MQGLLVSLSCLLTGPCVGQVSDRAGGVPQSVDDLNQEFRFGTPAGGDGTLAHLWRTKPLD